MFPIKTFISKHYPIIIGCSITIGIGGTSYILRPKVYRIKHT